MHKLLTIKHWQLFLLFIGLPILFEFVFAGILISSVNPSSSLTIFPIVIVIIMILSLGTIFGWLYTLGVNLHKKLPGTVQMNLTRFKIFLFIPVVYILALCIFMFIAFNHLSAGNNSASLAIFAIIFPLHIFSMFCIFYCFYFNAKALKSVESQRPVTFSR